MAAYCSSIELVTVLYTDSDSECYAPDLAYITDSRGEAGSVTIRLETTDEGDNPSTCSLTLPCRRSVEPLTTAAGERIVRVSTAASQIDIYTKSPEAQQYWAEALTSTGTPLI